MDRAFVVDYDRCFRRLLFLASIEGNVVVDACVVDL